MVDGIIIPSKKLIFVPQITTTLKNGEYLTYLGTSNIQIKNSKTIVKSTFFGKETYIS